MMQCKARLPTSVCLFVSAAVTGLAFATASGRSGEPEAPWLASDADVLNLITACAVLLGLLALLLLWRQRQLRNNAEQALQASHGQLRQLAGEQQRVREHERRRIGRDIHDDLGQHLLTLKIDLAMLQKNTHNTYTAHPQLARQLAMMVHNVDLSITSLRCVIDDLRPPALDKGFKAACEALLADFSRVNGIACDCALAPDNDAAQHDALLYRVLQEALANITRHACATHVSVSLRRQCPDDTLHLNISDNGVGMPATPRLGGCGLAGMRERLDAAGGTLQIDSQAGAGTCVHLTLPLSTPAYP